MKKLQQEPGKTIKITAVAMTDQASNHIDPFRPSIAHHLKTGEALEEDITKGLLWSYDKASYSSLSKKG